MPLFTKKFQDISTTPKKIATPLPREFSEFLPYHSHYNAHTIITKNGELMQTIRIDGNFIGKPCENLDGIHATIRDTLRQSIADCINSEDFSFWLHTIRRKKPMSHQLQNSTGFAGYVNAQWHASQQFDHTYYNEIYLTILHDGQPAPILDQANMKHVLFPSTNRRFRNAYLDSIYVKLDELTMNILGNLRQHCSTQRLSLVERDGIFYSEPLEFLGNILNLRTEQFPLPDLDLSVALETTRLTFGFNAIETRNEKTAARKFAGVLSLKQFREMHTDTVDLLLQAPLELIISQSFKFTPAVLALKHYIAQKDFFEISGDKKSAEPFGINEMLANHNRNATDFGESQTNIMIISDDVAVLDKKIEKFLRIFANLGLVAVREDIKMEECFWAQFPGNFASIRRRDPVATKHVGGFCRLNRFSSGTPESNHWGSYISRIPTTVGSHYFFNFHVKDNGHTVLYDFNSFGDRMGKNLEYFLLSQTQKFKPRICIFDVEQSARLFVNKLSGEDTAANYYSMSQLTAISRDKHEDKSPKMALNPFMLDDSRHNQSFLAAWAGLLISPETILDDNTRETLRTCVAELYALSPEERNLPNFAALIARKDPSLAESLAAWHSGGDRAGLFDFAQDTLSVARPVLGIDFTTPLKQSEYLLPLFAYLMHRIIASLDGTPTIIVLNEAWNLLENAFFAPRLESLMEMLRQNNVMLLMTTSRPADCAGTATFSTVSSYAATHIYLPDDIVQQYTALGLDVNDMDALQLLNMDRQKGDFLLKQNGESIGLRVNLSDMEDAIAIFANDIKALASARGAYAAIPKEY